MQRHLFVVAACCLPAGIAVADDVPSTTITVTVERGQDIGQSFGSLFQAATSDGSLVVGAGFQNAYNTRYRADRHDVQFFVRPTSGVREVQVEKLPRPNNLCGTYLYARDGVVRSTYGGLKAWDSNRRQWVEETSIGGTHETMRVGHGVLTFGESTVKYDGTTILDPPDRGSYQLFYYANGLLCFYHVHRGDGGYRPFANDADGFSKLVACPWTPGQPAVDLSQATVLTLPIVGETTFAWGQIGDQIVTGSNIGGFYVFENGMWRTVLKPNLGVSYQLYSTMAFRNRLLMGQYPTGRLFEYDGEKITDLAGWPPKLDGVSGSAREAQTTVVYGGDVHVGVWPWAELWRYSPDSKGWQFTRRVFDHPELSDRIVHPYDVENRGHAVGNLWGQRVTSLAVNGSDLFISTSAKFPCEWDPELFPFLSPDKWESYGAVYRMTMPGHLSAPARWTAGPTTFQFTVRGTELEIAQDGRRLAVAAAAGPLAERLGSLQKLEKIEWGDGIYGPFRGSVVSHDIVPSVAASHEQTPDDPPEKPPTRKVTIVTLGDSITKGVRSGVTVEQTFAALLQAQLQQHGHRAEVINSGVGGERTDQALKRIDQIIALKPDMVTVMYGTNDSYVDPGATASRITPDDFRSNLNRIVTELIRHGIEPILMTEPRWADAEQNGVGENPNLRLEAYMAVCRETAQAWRVPLVDHFAVWTDARQAGTNLRHWTTDGCHPNPAGHREMAATLMPVIRQAIGPNLAISRKADGARPIRVVCFGDSVTGVYYHTGSRRAYADMLGIAMRRVWPDAKVEMINAGISGNTTVDALARIDRDVLRHKPDVVTIMFGLNDMTRVPLADYRANLSEMVRQCRAAGAEVVLATPNNVIDTAGRPTEKLISYADAVRDVARELNVPLCDTYRELDAVRARDPVDWRLLMSDAIHPNMDGHKRLATALAQTITRQRVSLADVPAHQGIARTIDALRDCKSVTVLAMPPYDRLIEAAIRNQFPRADLNVLPWPVAGMTLAQIEQDAKLRVRAMKPDLVCIAVPDSAAVETAEQFVNSFAWTMNWSLNFGPPTWDCVVVHPAVTDPNRPDGERDSLIRRLVYAQDLPLIDRSIPKTDAATIVRDWFLAASREASD